MTRETREFTTPLGNKVIVNAYLNGREAQELKALMFSAMKVNMDDASSGRVQVGDVPSSFLLEQEKVALKYLLVSFAGNDKDPVSHLLDEFPQGEYNAVIAEINKIQNPTAPTK